MFPVQLTDILFGISVFAINGIFKSSFIIGNVFPLYEELMASLNAVFLLAVVLILSFGILLYIYIRNRNKRVREIVGEVQYRKLSKFRKDRSRYQRMVNDAHRGTVCIIKINNFEFLNELYGTGNFEEYMTAVSRRLSETLRGGYFHGRISMGEFIVYTTEPREMREIAEFASELVNLLKAAVIIKDVRITNNFNIGIASMEGTGSLHEEILRRANLAMWYSKSRGGNIYSFYTTEIDEKFIREDKIKKELGRALEENEFELYYQPIFNSNDETLYGIEALIRWNHPVKGLLKPDYFIVEAEINNMIIEIGYWVIERAFKDYNRLLNSIGTDFDKNVRLSINVSPSQFEDRNFLVKLSDLLIEYNMNPENVVLEITEQVYIQETLRVNELLRSIKKLGCKIAFDDFGVQYSTLAKLNEMNFDVVKIDRKFILGIPSDPVCMEIIRMLVSLTNATGKQLVAEGVDSQEQLGILNEFGCYTIQGFYYSQPIDFSRLLEVFISNEEKRKESDKERVVLKQDDGRQNRETEMMYREVFMGLHVPVTINRLIRNEDHSYDIILTKANSSYFKEFCLEGELIEGKSDDYIYPDLNTIRKNKIANSIEISEAIVFPVYFCESTGKVYDLKIIPLFDNLFTMIFDEENKNSSVHGNLIKTKELLSESNRMLQAAIKLGDMNILEYDIKKRILTVRLYNGEQSEERVDFPIEEYFEMIHPEEKREFHDRFLSFILENTSRIYEDDNLLSCEYRLRLPWKSKWEWTRTNLCISCYKGKIPLKAVAVNINIERYKEYEKKLEYRLTHDSLTDLLNRKGLECDLTVLWAKETPHALCILDIDDLRRANESLGHENGNRMLRVISDRIRESLPDDAVAARLSGDEFLVCFPFTTNTNLTAICKRIIKRIKVSDESGNLFTASMGVACFPAHSREQSKLMSIADMELDKVKKGNKNGFSIHQLN